MTTTQQSTMTLEDSLIKLGLPKREASILSIMGGDCEPEKVMNDFRVLSGCIYAEEINGAVMQSGVCNSILKEVDQLFQAGETMQNAWVKAIAKYSVEEQIALTDVIALFVRKHIDSTQSGKGQPAKARKAPAIKSASSILNTVYAPPVWIVPDLLPAGLTILSGLPKTGKSWLCLQLAMATGAGGKFLNRDTPKGKVLYLALEDSHTRLQSRMNAMSWPNDPAITVDFLTLTDYTVSIGALHKEGADILRGVVEGSGYHLVIIDTLSRAFLGIRDLNDSPLVSAALSPLQEMAMALNMSVLFIDHQSKSIRSNPNPINDILGSISKGATADAVWGLYREKGKPAKLMTTGRDIEETEIFLRFDRATSCWQVDTSATPATPYDLTPLEEEIMTIIQALGPSTCKQIAGVCTDRNFSSVYKALKRMEGLHITMDPVKKIYSII